MPGNSNIHDDFHWQLRDYLAHDGAIDPAGRALLDAHEDICLRMQAVHGLLFSPGGVPRVVRRQHPTWLAVATAD